MAVSFYDELETLDRPFVTITATIGKSDVEFLVRALSGEEEDALDAIQMDEYGRLIKDMMEAKPGALSELERVKAVYATKSASEIVEQLIVTREPDIRRRAIELSGIDFAAEAKKLTSLPEDEREAYAAERNAQYEESIKAATAAIRAEMEALSPEHLADQVAQVNVNIRALALAQASYNANYLSFVLYRTDNQQRVFADPQAVSRALSKSTIQKVVTLAQGALRTDLPFVSPDGNEPSGPPPSPQNSEADTADGGTPIETTPAA